MNLMLPDSGLLFWMTIIFAIVFFILAKFGFPVITGMVEKRAKRIDDALSAARKAEDAILHLTQEQERIISAAKEEQERVMQETAAERDRVLAEAQRQAREQAQQIIDEALVKIGEEKEAALREVRGEVAKVSIAIAEQVLRKELASEIGQMELVDKLVDEVSQSVKLS